MKITVRLFAILRERAGTDALTIELPDDATVAEAVKQIASEIAAVREHLKRVAFAVNREYVKESTALRDGDELALIPPVSGGCDE